MAPKTTHTPEQVRSLNQLRRIAWETRTGVKLQDGKRERIPGVLGLAHDLALRGRIVR